MIPDLTEDDEALIQRTMVRLRTPEPVAETILQDSTQNYVDCIHKDGEMRRHLVNRAAVVSRIVSPNFKFTLKFARRQDGWNLSHIEQLSGVEVVESEEYDKDLMLTFDNGTQRLLTDEWNFLEILRDHIQDGDPLQDTTVWSLELPDDGGYIDAIMTITPPLATLVENSEEIIPFDPSASTPQTLTGRSRSRRRRSLEEQLGGLEL